MANLPFRGEHLSFFLARQGQELHLYTCSTFDGDLVQHRYEEELPPGVEAITNGVSLTVFRRDGVILICAGNSLETPALGPFLAHHTLHAGKRYRIQRLTSTELAWKDLGVLDGEELQRVNVRLDALGYALYSFKQEPSHR